MAKAPRKNASAAERPPALLAMVLSRFECIQFPPEDSEAEKILMLDLAVSPFENGPSEREFFTQVMCRCTRRNYSDAPETHFTAMYSVMARTHAAKSEAAEKEAKDWIASAAWQNFANLFNMTNGQMHTEMPNLPLGPAGIEIKPLEYLTSAFDIFGDDDPSSKPEQESNT